MSKKPLNQPITSVFDQRHSTVHGNQYNVAGDLNMHDTATRSKPTPKGQSEMSRQATTAANRVATPVPEYYELGSYERDLIAIRDWSDVFWGGHQQHPHFTLHDPKHSAAIENKIAQWLAQASLRLTPAETFVLLGAVWLHDIGMQCRNPGFLKAHCRFELRTQPTPEQLNEIRKQHGLLSGHMIQDAVHANAARKYPELGLDGSKRASEFNAIALLARAHCGAIPAEVVNDYKGIAGGPVRLLLLAHLLRVGDALDAEEGRTNKDFYLKADWKSFRPEDQFHWLKHQYVSSIAVVGAGVFQYNYSIPDAEKQHYALIRACAEKPVRKHLAESGGLIRDFGVPFAEVRSRLLPGDQTLPFPMTEDALAVFKKEAGLPETSKATDDAKVKPTDTAALVCKTGGDVVFLTHEKSKIPSIIELCPMCILKVERLLEDASLKAFLDQTRPGSFYELLKKEGAMDALRRISVALEASRPPAKPLIDLLSVIAPLQVPPELILKAHKGLVIDHKVRPRDKTNRHKQERGGYVEVGADTHPSTDAIIRSAIFDEPCAWDWNPTADGKEYSPEARGRVDTINVPYRSTIDRTEELKLRLQQVCREARDFQGALSVMREWLYDGQPLIVLCNQETVKFLRDLWPVSLFERDGDNQQFEQLALFLNLCAKERSDIQNLFDRLCRIVKMIYAT